MSRFVRVAVIQLALHEDTPANLDKLEAQVRAAAADGAQVILPQELFSSPYFCKDQKPEYLALAHTRAEDPGLRRMQALAAELQVVIPASFFERAGNAFFNSLVVFDADGRDLGLYRKAHIPDGPGYQEKFYFSPGDTGFRVFPSRYGRLGVAICWDQWFPETARCLALQGAELLLYPTAIGSEPESPEIHSRDHWTRVMQGHAAANLMPVLAANRVGTETGEQAEITFYGGSFITDGRGALLCQMDQEEGFTTADVDLTQAAADRLDWGVFRDRRPDHYGAIATLDGGSHA